MKYRRTIGACVAAALGVFLQASDADSQQASLKELLVGTWKIVSWEQNKSDGTKLRQFGADPAGAAFFDANGRYIITVMRSDRANYANNSLWQGTAEENRATANGTMTYFGTYSVSELIEASQFILSEFVSELEWHRSKALCGNRRRSAHVDDSSSGRGERRYHLEAGEIATRSG
jgi:hypothetical protein